MFQKHCWCIRVSTEEAMGPCDRQPSLVDAMGWKVWCISFTFNEACFWYTTDAYVCVSSENKMSVVGEKHVQHKFTGFYLVILDLAKEMFLQNTRVSITINKACFKTLLMHTCVYWRGGVCLLKRWWDPVAASHRWPMPWDERCHCLGVVYIFYLQWSRFQIHQRRVRSCVFWRVDGRCHGGKIKCQ